MNFALCLVLELKDGGMPLTVKDDDAYAFLGVDSAPMDKVSFETSNEGFYMSQTGLIAKVLKTVGMTDSKQTRTPAASTPLGTDANGLAFKVTGTTLVLLECCSISPPAVVPTSSLPFIRALVLLTTPSKVMEMLSRESVCTYKELEIVDSSSN
jgi:hypothetical protein